MFQNLYFNSFVILSIFFFLIGQVKAIDIVLLEEDFQKSALKDSLREGLKQKKCWTNEPPKGWTIENKMPGLKDEFVGMPEWKAWAFSVVRCRLL